MRYGLVFLASYAVLAYTIVQRAENEIQVALMMGLALLAAFAFGLWLVSEKLRTIRKLREAIDHLQAESDKRREILARLHASMMQDQHR